MSDTNRCAIVAGQQNFADIFLQQAKPANVIELSALRIKPAAGICVVYGKRLKDLRDREVEP